LIEKDSDRRNDGLHNPDNSASSDGVCELCSARANFVGHKADAIECAKATVPCNSRIKLGLALAAVSSIIGSYTRVGLSTHPSCPASVEDALDIIVYR
jgi:hypothetical protein